MVKYLSIVCVILAVCSYFLYSALVNAKKEIGTLEGEKEALNNIVKGYQNAEVESNRTIRQLRERIKENKEGLDWYRTPIDSDSLHIVRERHNRNRKN